MQQFINQLVSLISQGLTAIGNVLRLIYDWSFGQVTKMIAIPFGNLPIWKQVLYVIVIAALVYLIYRIFTDLLEAVTKVFSAIIGLIVAIIAQLKPVLIAGVVAFGGAWVISNITIPWLQ